jgi:hypothetical protein
MQDSNVVVRNCLERQNAGVSHVIIEIVVSEA